MTDDQQARQAAAEALYAQVRAHALAHLEVDTVHESAIEAAMPAAYSDLTAERQGNYRAASDAAVDAWCAHTTLHGPAKP